MKIVFDFRKYDGIIGGVEQGLIQIARNISSNGHYAVILCKKNRLDPVINLFKDYSNIKVIPLNVTTHSISIKNAKLDSITIQNIAESEKADIVHFFYNLSFPFRKKVPSVLTVHDVIPFTYREAMGLFNNFFLYKPGIRTACRLNDRIATVSQFSKDDIVKKVGTPAEKISVIPNGLREPNPKNVDLEEDLKKRFNIDSRFVLNVGGIHERKNIVRLIQAFSNLVKESDCPGKLLITGNVSGHTYQKKMKAICDAAVNETGMQNRIVFTGFISEMELDSLFRTADLLIYPSLYEGFGIPILEAMKMGLPVITSNVTGMSEVASDAALLINPNSIEDMTDKMDVLLKNEDLRKNMIIKGIERAKSYTWEIVSRKYLDLYEDLIASHK